MCTIWKTNMLRIIPWCRSSQKVNKANKSIMCACSQEIICFLIFQLDLFSNEKLSLQRFRCIHVWLFLCEPIRWSESYFNGFGGNWKRNHKFWYFQCSTYKFQIRFSSWMHFTPLKGSWEEHIFILFRYTYYFHLMSTDSLH